MDDYVSLILVKGDYTMRNWTAAFLSILLLLNCLLAANSLSAQDTVEARRKVVTRVMPQYPILLRSMRIRGNVRSDVLVAADGKVESIETKGGHPLFVQSAEDALRQWKWEPAAHESHVIVDLTFNP